MKKKSVDAQDIAPNPPAKKKPLVKKHPRASNPPAQPKSPPPPPCDHIVPLTPKMQSRLKTFQEQIGQVQQQLQAVQQSQNAFIEALLLARDIDNVDKVRFSPDGKAIMVDCIPTGDNASVDTDGRPSNPTAQPQK